jgi:pentose-5-phosphate-3-epimerase
VTLAESRIREITDFQQTIDELPGGIKLDKVEAAEDGVDVTVRGSNIVLAG